MKKILSLIISFLSISQLIFSQTESPDSFLGYSLGSRFTRHYQVTNYFEYVAANNSNVKLIKYGETYEKRPLQIAVITSPENFSKLEEIRKNHLRSTGILEGDYKQNDIAFVWLSYNVHGNEAVSTEVAMKTLYELVNPSNSKTKEWLKNTIVIIDPCINPDGRERYVNWYYQKQNLPYNSNPDAAEHHEPWPGGRTNHYLFDLNRDWAWATQIETQKRLVVYNKWMPEVHVDFHEQGVNQPYYFAPAAEPYHEIITNFQREFQTTVGKNNAKYFDKNGWLYFTKEIFDLLYPSYGDTYPMFNGAIGMTYEQGGSGRAGLVINNEEGNELTLKDRIAHHFTTSMSTIEVSSANAIRLNKEFFDYFNTANKNPKGKYKTYIIKNDNNNHTNKLLELLDRHKIKYGTANSNKNYSGFNYINNKVEKFKIDKKDLIVSAYQPKSNLIKSLFEPQTKLNDSLTYDITAWSLPYAMGLKAYATASKIDVQPYQKVENKTSFNFNEKPYAYISKWNSTQDVSFLAYLLKNKIKVRYALRPFTIKNENYTQGTLIITRAGNKKLANLDSLVQVAAIKFNRNIVPVSSGLVDSGKDFGSSNVVYIKPPKVALLSGKGVSSYGFGSIWHFFEQQIHYQVNVIDTDYFNTVDFHDYNVIILPNGYYGKLLDKNRLEELKKWVEKGGKLIAINSAISVFANSEDFDISIYEDKNSKDAAKKLKDSINKEERLKLFDQQERNYISNTITGGVFKTTLDNTNPLAFGYDNYYYTLKQGNRRYAYLKNGNNVSVIKKSSDLVSGFAGKNVVKTMSESLVFGVERKGKGTIVYLVDDPLFRSFWENGKLIFSNAVFLVGQ